MTHYELEKRLDRSNRFFSSVIHDIRTPMNAVLGFLELLAEDADSDTLDYIEAAHKSGKMVVALANDVLDTNRLESGRLDIDPHFFSLLKEFENTVLLFYYTALKKKIDFTVYFDPKIPYLVKSDPYRIKQIVNNLLSNAFKFTPAEGCVEMDFSYDADSDELSISISDTGIGISQEESEYIFDSPLRVLKNNSAKFGSSGLGLTISKQLSILLGGTLELESEKGKGSRFTLKIPCSCSYVTMSSIDRPIDLPKIIIIEGANCRGRHIKILESYFDALDIEYSLTKASQEELSRIEREEDSIYIGVEMSYKNDAFISFMQKKSERVILLETTLFPKLPDVPKSVRVFKLPLLPHSLFDALRATSKGEESNKKVRESGCKSGKIVLTDDNPLIIKLLRELSLRMGHTVKEAYNGKEALEILQNESADILIIDKDMPIMNGIEAVKLIRELPTGKELRIYALTGDWDEETRKSFLSVGADGVLHKPLDIDEFRRLICL
jgi:CheY-like chemotaxis protein/anti-sigma regulatory factor (Ser/Thr protein kinase)